jgi:transcriptional regulator with XRE-family HTH domain
MGASKDWEPTIRSYELGKRLREAMERAGLTVAEASRILDWSDSRVSRLLSGKRGGNSNDVVAFLTLCRVTGNDREELLELSENLRHPGWVQDVPHYNERRIRLIHDLERGSVAIDEFENHVVSGLLQTREYARAIHVSAVNYFADEASERTDVRLARQELINRPDGRTFRFFLHELVFSLPVGGPVVMSDQLHHLLRVSVLPHVQIRVVPRSKGAHAAISGSFRIMDVRDFKPIVYIEADALGLYREEREEVQRYRDVLSSLDGIALDRAQSRELIAALAVQLYGEEVDAPGTVAKEQPQHQQ